MLAVLAGLEMIKETEVRIGRGNRIRDRGKQDHHAGKEQLSGL